MNKYESDFDLSDYYIHNEEPNEEHISKSNPIEFKKNKDRNLKDNDFQLSEYQIQNSEEKKPKQLEYVTEKSPEETKKMSVSERLQYAKDLVTQREYDQSKGFVKGALSGATLGLSEKIPGLQKEETDLLSGFGELAGVTAPIGLIGKAISIPFKMSGLMNYAAGRIGLSASTGAAYSTGKQLVKGEGIDPVEVATEAAEFGVLHGLFEAAPKAYRWLKSLNTQQQADMLLEGVIPKNLNPNQYKFYETEVVPEIQKAAQMEYEQSLKQATEDLNKEFSQKMQNVKAQHENDLIKQAQEKQLSQQEFQNAQQEYQNKLKQVAAEHESKVIEIEEANKIAQQEYQSNLEAFEDMKIRQQNVSDAIGDNFSPEEVKSYREAGQKNVEAIRSNDAHDYNEVKEAYKISENLNSSVTVEQPNLVQDLITSKNKLTKVPKLSPPQEQLLSAIDSILENTAILNKNGDVIGYKPINNNVLAEQAKALRYFMDFNFQHGNTRGIFTPTVNQIENAIETGAINSGNAEAATAEKRARKLYSNWAKDYDNDYIRPFRDTSNEDYIKLFNSVTEPDNLMVVNRILEKSNAGQQVSKMNKRALIEKNTNQFVKNPGKIDKNALEDTFKKIRGVVSTEEEQLIRDQLSTLSEVKEPSKPKLKELPRGEIPLFKGKSKEVPEITEVKIPIKPELKPTSSMKASSKLMKVTPEQAIKMSNTPTGLKQLKEKLPKKLYEKIGKDKVKDVFYKGKVEKKLTGSDIYEVINEGENYSILSEILGEDVVDELLVNSKELSSKKITLDNMKKLGMKAGALKTLLVFGII